MFDALQLPICYAYTLFIATFITRAVLSFIPLEPGGIAARIRDFCEKINEPVLRPVRGLIGPIQIGGMGLDLSFMLVTFVLFFLWGPICSGV